MASRSVAPVEVPEVPALVPTPATLITAEDIAIPRLYVGNFLSQAVRSQAVKFGDVYLAAGADDEDPQLLWSLGSDDPGVLMHVLHLRKGKSWQRDRGAPLEVFDYGDPAVPDGAWTTYSYTVLLPEIDQELPARMLLTKSGTPVARKINTVLARNAPQGPMYNNAFRVTSAKRQKDTNEWAIFQVATTTAQAEHVAAAAEMFAQIAPGLEQATRVRTTADEPEI